MWLQYVGPDLVVWNDHQRPEVLHVLGPDGREELTSPGIVEWHGDASRSPDGKLVALGGYLDPPPDGSFELGDEIPERNSRLALIDVESRTVDQAEGDFPGFAWTPAWTRDSSWVVFSAPFRSRRLFDTQPEQLELHEWRFKRSAPSPMLDVTDRTPRLAESSGA